MVTASAGSGLSVPTLRFGTVFPKRNFVPKLSFALEVTSRSRLPTTDCPVRRPLSILSLSIPRHPTGDDFAVPLIESVVQHSFRFRGCVL